MVRSGLVELHFGTQEKNAACKFMYEHERRQQSRDGDIIAETQKNVQLSNMLPSISVSDKMPKGEFYPMSF